MRQLPLIPCPICGIPFSEHYPILCTSCKAEAVERDALYLALLEKQRAAR